MSANAFIGQPPILHVSEKGTRGITGVASTSSSLYVVRHVTDHVEVLDRENFTVTSKIYIAGLKNAKSLAACQHYNCLYVSNEPLKVIHRVDLSNRVVSKWSVRGQPQGVSITRNHNLIRTPRDTTSCQV